MSGRWKKRFFLTGCILFLLVFSASRAVFGETADNQIQDVELMDYVETVFDAGNGMISSEANTVLQDRKGYVWVGSYAGLARYNGTEFENMGESRKGAPKDGVRSLMEDTEGRIWIGTNDNGIYCYKNDSFLKLTEKISSLDLDTESLSVRAIAEGKDGTIYFGTTAGILCINRENVLFKVGEEEIGNTAIRNLVIDQDGNLWGVTSNGGLFYSGDDGELILCDGDMLGYELGRGLALTDDGTLYVGTDRTSLLRFQLSEKMGAGEFLEDMEVLSLGKKETVNDIYEDSQGKIWVATDHGLGYLDRESVFHEIHEQALDTVIDDIQEDYEGNLWITSSRRGLFQLSRSKFWNVSYEAGIEDQTVNTVLLHNRRLYIGTDTGLSIMDENGRRIENALTRELGGIRIRHMMVDSGDNLWISTYKERGILCYQEKEDAWNSFGEEQGLLTEQIRMTVELSDGTIAAATNRGVVFLGTDGVREIYDSTRGIYNETILCLEELEDGTVLAGSDGNGIYRIDRASGEVSGITTEDGLSSGVVLRIVYDKAVSGLWICGGNGLSLWDKEGIHNIQEAPGSTGSVFDIKMSEEYLWLLKANEVIRISRENLLEKNSDYEVFGRGDGLTDSITANSWNFLSNDQMLFLCTSNGISYMDTKAIYCNTTVPRISVSSIVLDEKTYYGAQDIRVPAENRRMTISVDLLSYGPAGGTLEYYLEGFDKKPIRVSGQKNQKISYTTLSGGAYVFHLKGINSDGVESTELTFRIEKERSIYEKKAFYVWAAMSAGILLLLLVVGIQYWNRRRILKRQRAYRQMTDQAVRIVANTIDAKDAYTRGHSNRVAEYAAEIGKRYGLSGEELEQLHYSALLHDIGKIGIPDQILNKKGKLTDEEYETIKQHPTIGGNILRDCTLVPWIAAGAEFHHERYDGKGYNKGLKGDEIPLYARIIAVADAFDSMNSSRVYRPSLTWDVIRAEIAKGAGSQFDPKLAGIMLDIMDEMNGSSENGGKA